MALPKTLYGPDKLASAAKTLPVLLLAGEAMADTDEAWLTSNFDAQFPKVTRNCSGRH